MKKKYIAPQAEGFCIHSPLNLLFNVSQVEGPADELDWVNEDEWIDSEAP